MIQLASRAVWVQQGKWDTNLAYLFPEGEQIGDALCRLEQICWVRKKVSYPAYLAVFHNHFSR